MYCSFAQDITPPGPIALSLHNTERANTKRNEFISSRPHVSSADQPVRHQRSVYYGGIELQNLVQGSRRRRVSYATHGNTRKRWPIGGVKLYDKWNTCEGIIDHDMHTYTDGTRIASMYI